MTAIALRLSHGARWLGSIDKVWLTIAAALALGLLLAPALTRDSLLFAGDSLWQVLPFVLLSVAAAAYTQAASADRLIARVFSGHPVAVVFIAAAFGAVSPFCSCGVIPLIAALLAMGVPLGPVMAFWLASPIMDPEMFAMTWGTLGLQFAVAKTVAAIGIGLFGGFTTMAVQRLGAFPSPLRPGIGDGGCGASAVRGDGRVHWRIWTDGDRLNEFWRKAGQTALFLGKWLLLAFLAESLMVRYVPAESIAGLLGGDSLWAIPLAVLIGIPTYLNGYGALPVVKGLLDLGMAPGAAMAFVTAGGVSCIPAAIAVFALVRLPFFVWYAATATTGALLVGLAYQAVAG